MRHARGRWQRPPGPPISTFWALRTGPKVLRLGISHGSPVAVQGAVPADWRFVSSGTVPFIEGRWWRMTTPGFTAEASLPRVAGRHGRVRAASPLAGQLLALAQLEAPVLRSPGQSAPPVSAIEIDLYGNWCGPGNSGPGAPVDPVDQACCWHDICFCTRGYDRCSCNLELIEGLTEAMFDSRSSAEGRINAGGIIEGLLRAPCWCECCPDIPLVPCFTLPGLAGVCSVPFCD